nr:hypothetical protein [Tanacetum cinerariifolium]
MNESISGNTKCKSIFEIENIQRDINTIITGVVLCKQKIANPTWYGHVEPIVKNTIEQNFNLVISRINLGLHIFLKRLNEEMVADLRYFNSLESEVDSLTSQLETQKTQFMNEIDRLSREYFYADHMNAILGVYTELDEVTNLQWYMWKPKSKQDNVNQNVSMPLANASRTANVKDTMTSRRSTV